MEKRNIFCLLEKIFVVLKRIKYEPFQLLAEAMILAFLKMKIFEK